MNIVKEGDNVSLSCEFKLENDDICYKTEDENYIDVVVGKGKFFPLLENELINMEEGETKTVTLEPKDAFGCYIDDLIIEVPKDVFRYNAELDINLTVKINAPSGKTYYGTITKISEENLTLDLNHPLAGKKIIITMKVVSIDEDKPSTDKKSLFKSKKTKKIKSKKISFNPLKTKSDPSRKL